MKISTAKTQVLHLSRNPDQYVWQVNGATPKQLEKFKYLGVTFKSEVRQDEELDTRIGKASAVMQALHYSVILKRELSKKAKLSIFKTAFVPILTYGHESWVMTKRVRSQVQASKMRFLWRIEGVALLNKKLSSDIQTSLNIEQLLLWIERSQLKWFGHESRMPYERLSKQALLAKANGRRPVGWPRTRQTITWRILDKIAWVFTQAKWWMWWKTMRCGGLILSCCPRNPHGKVGNEEEEAITILAFLCKNMRNIFNFLVICD